MMPDERGKFGLYGGQFVPETLMPAPAELTAAYGGALQDPAFVAELLCSYVGRPPRSPLACQHASTARSWHRLGASGVLCYRNTPLASHTFAMLARVTGLSVSGG
jgi:tryptophan synthase beta chain